MEQDVAAQVTGDCQQGFGLAIRIDLVTGGLYAHANPMHLWFLYYLAFFYPLGLAAAWLVGRAGSAVRGRIDRGYRRALRSPIRPALFAVPTALTLWPMVIGGFDTPQSFWPSITILVAYGVFFGFGWSLYAHVDLLPSFSRHAWKQIALALFLWPLNVLAVTCPCCSCWPPCSPR
jgi:AcrR family transcriptional regulator